MSVSNLTVSITGYFDSPSNYLPALSRIAAPTFHLVSLVNAKKDKHARRRKDSVVIQACASPVFDYIYGTLWRCRHCPYHEHRTPEARS